MKYLKFISDYLSYTEGSVIQTKEKNLTKLVALKVAVEIEEKEYKSKQVEIQSEIAKTIAKTKAKAKESKELEKEGCKNCNKESKAIEMVKDETRTVKGELVESKEEINPDNKTQSK